MKKIFCTYSGNKHEDSLVQKLFEDIKSLPDVKLTIDFELFSKSASNLDNLSIYESEIAESDYILWIMSEYFNDAGWNTREYESAYINIAKNHSHLRIIKVVISRNGQLPSGLLGVGAYGTVIGLGKNYQKGLNEIIKAFNLNLENQIIDFNLIGVGNQNAIINIADKISANLIRKIASDPCVLKTFNRRLFEELIAELFNGFGFEVELTKQTKDGGRDIIAIKNSVVKMKYLIECKRPDPKNQIGIKPVRELFGVKTDEKATKAILATTSYFTKDALIFFERNKWELEPKDFDGIVSWINDYKAIKNIV